MATGLMPVEFFEVVKPLLPEDKPVGASGGRPRILNEVALRVIWYVLTTGIRWQDAFDEVEDVVACGVGMGEDELGDGASIARQHLAVRPAGHAVVRRLHRLLGREPLLPRGGGSADAEQAGDLGDLESRVAMQQEVAEQAVGIVIFAAVLPKSEGGLQQATLLGAQSVFGNLGLRKPLCKSAVRGRHENPP